VPWRPAENPAIASVRVDEGGRLAAGTQFDGELDGAAARRDGVHAKMLLSFIDPLAPEAVKDAIHRDQCVILVRRTRGLRA